MEEPGVTDRNCLAEKNVERAEAQGKLQALIDAKAE